MYAYYFIVKIGENNMWGDKFEITGIQIWQKEE